MKVNGTIRDARDLASEARRLTGAVDDLRAYLVELGTEAEYAGYWNGRALRDLGSVLELASEHVAVFRRACEATAEREEGTWAPEAIR